MASKRNTHCIRTIKDKHWNYIEQIIGLKIGRLTIIGKALEDKTWSKQLREFSYVCRCTCSNYTVVRYCDLKYNLEKPISKRGIEMCPECKHLQLLKNHQNIKYFLQE